MHPLLTLAHIGIDLQIFYDTFVLQTKDDNAPELRQVFTLELTSASGGATINPTASSAQIMVTASDHPHGE